MGLVGIPLITALTLGVLLLSHYSLENDDSLRTLEITRPPPHWMVLPMNMR